MDEPWKLEILMDRDNGYECLRSVLEETRVMGMAHKVQIPRNIRIIEKTSFIAETRKTNYKK